VINRSTLLKHLQALLPHIEKDILAYSEHSAELGEHLKQQYQVALEAERTSEHFVAWREAQVTQAAVAWVLTCVFVRFLEDNHLLDAQVLAGPVSNSNGDNALQFAKERMVAYYNENPTKEERDYLLDLFSELERFPVIRELLDHRHNPLWLIPVSADGAKRLIDFFQKIDPETGEIEHDFTDSDWDTRFLGDLYQDLSESVRKRYALLQTPEFVEEFILDYTLTPAIEAFGLPKLRLIDPTCGSGHFLLTTFERIFNLWCKREPGTNTRELAQRALDVVHGTDINPYAIAICRFRLLIAAMKASDSFKIKDAPNFHFHLACGDSLLHGRRFEWQGQGNQQNLLDEKSHVYEVEDPEKLNEILGQRYHAVVGNPPYITVKDKALNQIYRNKYPTCHRQYSLGVPFTERFFDLTLWPEGNKPAGFMGMITANSFMKREFGKKLIEEYLPKKDLTHVIDTSGAYIPGHGTPTVILFARNQAPKSEQIQAVLGIRGEPSTPDKPSEGKVWSSIVNLLPKQNAESEYVSAVTQNRSSYAGHPWSVGGGGASELKELLENGLRISLKEATSVIGFICMTRADDVYFSSEKALRRLGISEDNLISNIEGDKVRDWSINEPSYTCFPYDSDLNPFLCRETEKYLWPHRTALWLRREPNGNHIEIGLTWFEWSRFQKERFKIPLSITFAFVATHNHFVLDRGGKVFNRSAPVIKLPETATEDDHFALLGLLNSSIACFWMKQVFHNKGGGGIGGGLASEEWEQFYEYTGTGLKGFPVAKDPDQVVLTLSARMDSLAQKLGSYAPETRLTVDGNTANDQIKTSLASAQQEEAKTWQAMVALQEELDWHTYRLYGLTDQALCYSGELPLVKPGERAFEIALARKIATGDVESTWFTRHGSTPVTEVPTYWPEDYRQLIEQRLELIEANQWIKLVEQPEYKRRWNRDSWDERLHVAAKEWLLDQCELLTSAPELCTSAQLADRLSKVVNADQVAEIYSGTDMVDWQTMVTELVVTDQVPQMAAARLKPAAMAKWQAWNETWDKQRQEDAIDARFGVDKPLSEVDAKDTDKVEAYEHAKQQAETEKQKLIGTIPVPPQYKSPDFRQTSYWSLRGKLDVPKERFFSLPGAEKDGDSTLVIGWAGLNHLQRATAIASWYLERKENEGWSAERLLPMLVALNELIPWLKQWHNEIDPEFGERMGDYYEGFLLEELRLLDVSLQQLNEWLPAEKTKKRGGRTKKSATKKD
jgi:hypothetical protein